MKGRQMMPSPADQPTNQDYLVVQATVLAFAVEALIATHPEPQEVRRIFNQLFGQFQSGILATGGATLASTDLARQLAEKIFSSP